MDDSSFEGLDESLNNVATLPNQALFGTMRLWDNIITCEVHLISSNFAIYNLKFIHPYVA